MALQIPPSGNPVNQPGPTAGPRNAPGQMAPTSLAFNPPAQNLAPRDNVRVAPQGASLHALNLLDNEPPPFAQVDARFRLRDLDGLDQRSSHDLRGEVDLNLGISRDLLENSMAEAKKQAPDLDFKLSYDHSQKQYRIAVSYPTRLGRVGLGSVYLQPAGDKLRLEVGGLAGGAARVVNALSLGYARQATETLVKQLSQDMGFKVSSNTMTTYTLEPDLANSPVFKEIPLAGGESLKLESLTPGNGSLVNMQTDAQGNLSLRMQKIQAVASSQAGAARAVADREGPDQLDIAVEATLKPDFSANVSSTLNLDLNIQPQERAGLQQRMKNLTGQDLPVSGQLRIENLRVDAELAANGQVRSVNASGGQIEAEALNLNMGPNQVNFSEVRGSLQMQHQNGQSRLAADDVQLKGRLSNGQGALNIQDLSFSGSLVHDNRQPQQVRFEIGQGQSLNFSGQLQQGTERISIQDLSLKQARLQTDLSKGELALLPQNGQTPDARIKRLSLPDATLYDLRLQGTLQANLNQGSVTLDAKSFGLAARAGDVNLQWLQGSGKLSMDGRGGISLQQARFSTQGQVGDIKVNSLKGQGNLQISPSGQINLQSVRNLELDTDLGLKLKGDFSGQINGNQIQLQTQGNKAARIDMVNPDLRLDLQGLEVQGQVRLNAASGEVHFASSPNGDLRLNQGRIDGLQLQDVRLQGQIEHKNNRLIFAPENGGQLKVSGQLNDVRIEGLESSGSVSYDLQRQVIAWDAPTRAALPRQGIQDLQTEGPLSIQILPSQELVFRSDSGVINATLGDLRLENIKTNGEVIFDPRTQNLRFAGAEGQGLQLEGSFNGHPLKISSSGQIQINDRGQDYQIRGEGLQINGLVDGFELASPAGAEGTFSMKRDFSGFELQDLNFGFAVDDIEVNSQGTVRSTPEGGIAIALQGQLGSQKSELQALLAKLAGREDLGGNFQQGMQQVNQALDQAFADFEGAQLQFEDLELVLDKNMQLERFSVRNNSEIHNARMSVDLNGKKTLLPMGTVNWTADVQGTPAGVTIPEGQLAFSLTDELRGKLVAEVKKQLEDSGLKDVQLQLHPDGKLEIQNATYKRKRLGVSAELEINTRIVDNHLEVSLDKLKLKNALFNLVAQVAGAPDKLADEVDKMLTQHEVGYQRRNRRGQADPDSGRIFRIDLQALLQKVDPGIQLNSASLSPQGRVEVSYAYRTGTP